MKNTIQNSDLFLVEFENTCNLLTPDQMQELQKPFIKSTKQGEVVSIKKVKSLAEQRSVLTDLSFTLKSNAAILESLINGLYKLNDNSKEYIDALENISFFVHQNIIDATKEKINDLNSVLEYEGNRN